MKLIGPLAVKIYRNRVNDNIQWNGVIIKNMQFLYMRVCEVFN